jgi:hypothetical protein
MNFRVLAAALFLAVPVATIAADHKYEATGPVVSVDGNQFTIQKGKENWTFTMSPDIKGNIFKVGDKVTVHYFMTAKSVEIKPSKKKK